MMAWAPACRRAWRLPLLLPHVLAGLLAASLMPAPQPGRPVPLLPVMLWSRILCRLLGVRLVVHGAPHRGTVLMVANHISWLDVFCIASVCPARFLAKQEVAGWPVLGWLSRRAGTEFIHRGDSNGAGEAAERMIWRLRQGERMVIFPEATSTSGATVKRFHPRLFQAAIHARCPVQAIALRYPHPQGVNPAVPFVGDDGFLPHLWRLLGESTIVAELHFFDPIWSHSRDELARMTHQQVLGAVTTPAVANRPVTTRQPVW